MLHQYSIFFCRMLVTQIGWFLTFSKLKCTNMLENLENTYMNIKDNLFHEIEHFYDLDPNFTISNHFYQKKNCIFLIFHLAYTKLKHATMYLTFPNRFWWEERIRNPTLSGLKRLPLHLIFETLVQLPPRIWNLERREMNLESIFS